MRSRYVVLNILKLWLEDSVLQSGCGAMFEKARGKTLNTRKICISTGRLLISLTSKYDYLTEYNSSFNIIEAVL